MKCRICFNTSNNTKIVLKEMMYGVKDEFDYFECASCGCIQIAEVPSDLGKYYPNDYYSYTVAEVPLKKSWIRSVHFDYYAFNKHQLLGSLLALKFKPSGFYTWLKELYLHNRNESILDIGCGNGQLLKRMYRLGFNNLTGIDPFLEKDLVYNDSIKLFKKDIFQTDTGYDVIMMHHSLEHMDRQDEVIQKAASLLKKGGRMLIRIPIVSKPLMDKYGSNVVSLDAPRHLFIHSLKSITGIIEKNNLSIYKTMFDAEAFSIMGSEQYSRGISNVNDERSYFQNPAGSVFKPSDIERFENEIKTLNQKGESDSVALYIHN